MSSPPSDTRPSLDEEFTPKVSSDERLRTVASATDSEPPLYRIDLSSTPEFRYNMICNDYKGKMAELVVVYDDLLAFTPSPRTFGFLARHLLKKVYTNEETAEIKGIAQAADIPLHLVVAYNTFLDLFSGCISGGMQVKLPRDQAAKILHFRNLDWGMDILRQMIIRVEYLLQGKVVARAVTYAGYVGVLTGVREGLSMSLNYRVRAQSTSSNFANRLHYLLILLGRRPAIASQLRKILLSTGPPPSLDFLSQKFAKIKSSSCYLVFCTPSAVLGIQKSLTKAIISTSADFLTITNHDVAIEAWSQQQWHDMVLDSGPASELGAIREIVQESIERKERMCDLWRNKRRGTASIEDVKKWLRTYPIRNECTHFSCIMDPSAEGGGLVWVEVTPGPFDGE